MSHKKELHQPKMFIGEFLMAKINKNEHMKKMGFLLAGLFFFTSINAQLFAAEIAAFKKQDSLVPPPQQAILFVGSSSFTKWTDMQEYFPNHLLINRGFGGSTLPDVIRYQNDIIFPYHARQIVIYAGENDIASADSVSPNIVLERFAQLYGNIRANDAAVPILYISLKPSILRWAMHKRMQAANKLIKNYLKKCTNATFISVWKPMLGKDGQPLPDIFTEDKLHLNAKGYAIWKKLIEPFLL